MLNVNQFDAPIPGQSLTTPPGSAPYEKAPQFADPDDALEYVWEQITKPMNAGKLLMSLKAGATVEFITRTMLFNGFTRGMWTPDVCLIMGRPVMSMIVRIAELKGLTDIKIFNERQGNADLLANLAGMIKEDKKAPEAAPVEEELDAGEAEPSIKIGMLNG